MKKLYLYLLVAGFALPQASLARSPKKVYISFTFEVKSYLDSVRSKVRSYFSKDDNVQRDKKIAMLSAAICAISSFAIVATERGREALGRTWQNSGTFFQVCFDFFGDDRTHTSVGTDINIDAQDSFLLIPLLTALFAKKKLHDAQKKKYSGWWQVL